MSNDLNQCNFIGRLSKDPESRFLPNGDEVVNFSIAVGESWTDKNTGQKKENTEWVRIVAFGGLAGICSKYLKKGSKIYVSGKLKTRSWDDKNTGEKKYATEIVANQMQMLGKKSGEETANTQPQPQRSNGPPVQAQTSVPAPADDFEDGIPF